MNECWFKISGARSNYTKENDKTVLFVSWWVMMMMIPPMKRKKKKKLVQYYKLQEMIFSKEHVSKLT